MTRTVPAGDPAGKQQVQYAHDQQRGESNQRMREMNIVRRFRFVFQVRAITFIVIDRLTPLPLQPEQAKEDNKQRADKTQPRGRPALVPKKLVGIMFWICGVPGRASMVNENAPSATVAGINRLGMPLWRNSSAANGYTANATTNSDTPP